MSEQQAGDERMQDYVEYAGAILPPRSMRPNQGLRRERLYLKSTTGQLDLLSGLLNDDVDILDFGSGPGRMAIGLLHYGHAFGSYLGVDAREDFVDWGNAHLGKDGRVGFVLAKSRNALYAPGQEGRSPIPAEAGSRDLAIANSVFSHFEPEDTLFYFGEIARVLRVGGTFYLTGFFESDVPDYTENPRNYIGPCTVPLQRTRYNCDWIFARLADAGLQVASFRNRSIGRTGQSELIATKG